MSPPTPSLRAASVGWAMIGWVVAGCASAIEAVDAGDGGGPSALAPDVWVPPSPLGSDAVVGSHPDGQLSPPSPDATLPSACGELTQQGVCQGNVLHWCQDGRANALDCDQTRGMCGFSDSLGRNVCLREEGPPPGCQAPPEGECDPSGVLYTCEGGELRLRDCRAEGRVCAWSEADMRFDCRNEQPAGCPGVPAEGRCQGNRLERCVAGRLEPEDCAARGLICGPLPGGVFACTREAPPPVPDPCEGIALLGNCEGQIAVYCIDDERVEVDCRVFGVPCLSIPGVGAICLDPNSGM